jgi:uncharacterized protein (DUF2267 family)
MSFNINKFAQEGFTFVNELSNELGHPGENEATSRLLRSVLHVVRDRITMSENLDVIAQLPMFLKAVYVEQWKYREKPLKFDTMGEFCNQVKEHQARMGEREFNWNESTDVLVLRTFGALRKYLTQGTVGHVLDQMPQEIKEELQAELSS